MENQHTPEAEDLNPVSRKSNEEIDTDDAGNLLIHGKPEGQEKSRPSDGPVSNDLTTGRDSLSVED